MFNISLFNKKDKNDKLIKSNEKLGEEKKNTSGSLSK